MSSGDSDSQTDQWTERCLMRQVTADWERSAWCSAPATLRHLQNSAASQTCSTVRQKLVLYNRQWCGLRPSVRLRTRPVWDQKNPSWLGLGLGLAHCGLVLGLGLAGLVLFCETRSYHTRRHNDLEGHSNFQVLFIVSLYCAWNITTVEINSGVHLLKS